MGTSRKWNKIIFGAGLSLFVVGIAFGIAWPSIYNIIFQSMLQFSTSSETYQMWLDAPIPIYIDFYLFNWTNAEEFKNNKSVVPDFREVGPFSFEEVHERVDIVWNDDYTISFNETRTWTLRPEQSLDLSINITCANPLALSMAYLTRDWNLSLYYDLVNTLINQHEDIYRTATAGEWLFDGYHDELLDIIAVLQSVTYIPIPYKRFGWFFDRNGSSSYDGRFTMQTGVDDLYNVGMMSSWNNMTKTPYYKGHCGLVDGNVGEVMPPMKDPIENITVFSSDLCSSMTLEYIGQSDVEGVDAATFAGTAEAFDNGTLDPQNSCYCNEECPPVGVRNVSQCRLGSPAFVSYPHFYLADEWLRESISGMEPNQTKHEFILKLQKDTGIPVEVKARLQVNLLMQPYPFYDMFRDVPKLYMPFLWFEQRAVLSSSLATLANIFILLPDIGIGFFYAIGGIGGLMVFVRFMMVIYFDNRGGMTV